MYKYYNAHPKGLWVDDCVKRAIAVTTRMDYMDVQKQLNDYKKVTGAAKFYTDGNPIRFVEEVLGAKRIRFPKSGPLKMTAGKFSETHKKGRYILNMEGHFSACVNGVLLDTWDPSDERVLSAYLITPLKDSQKINHFFCYTTSRVSEDKTNVTFYDGNGKFVSKTLSGDDADSYIESLNKRGYPDMTNAEEWI